VVSNEAAYDSNGVVSVILRTVIGWRRFPLAVSRSTAGGCCRTNVKVGW
jgi:hypothetical protein